MRLPSHLLLTVASSLLFALAACKDGPKDTSDGDVADSSSDDTSPQAVDADADGYADLASGGTDCDDSDPEIHPGQGEICNAVDDNCNGVADEGLPDSDEDGTADCSDTETCDGKDNNGDGTVDEGFGDVDNDGVADCVGTEICDGLDNDEDGDVDEGYDADGDGYVQCETASAEMDCDDSDAAINPGATEDDNDQVDNNCDGLIDDGGWEQGTLTISEIMFNPEQVADPAGEYFEVYNASRVDLILNGLIIADSSGEEHQVTADDLLILEPGDFFVFAGNDDVTTNGYVEVGYVYTDISLSNESDDLILYAGAVMIDTVEWDDGASMPDPTGASVGTDFGGYDSDLNDDPSYWCAATETWTDSDGDDKGSPGLDNEYCSTVDHDGDGFTGDEGDCDDGDDTTYPGAWEGTDPLDNDCDGVAETAPVASATATSTGYTCDNVALSGAGSYDIEGAALTYTWELTGAPAASARTSADINTTSSVEPTFSPDVAGNYTFTLTVNDGGTDSAPTTVSVSVSDRSTNSAPVANAGADQSASATVTCSSSSYGTVHTCDDCDDYDFTLDATGSTDVDGDVLTYAWSLTSGSYASLSGSTGSSVTVTVSGVPATYGSTTSDVSTVDVVVTDCMGATHTDSVSVTYSCTGS